MATRKRKRPIIDGPALAVADANAEGSERAPASVAAPAGAKPAALSVGRMFVNPAFDYLLIGGGLSIVTMILAWLLSDRQGVDAYMAGIFPGLILLSNSAHFAASSVRLYTKPGAFRQLPFLTMGFPLVTLAATGVAIYFADVIGRHFYNLYLAWSPYHYSAQAYGLAMMYCYRSGCKLEEPQRKWLWWSCMTTFFYALFGNRRMGTGIWWVVPWSVAETYPALRLTLIGMMNTLAVLAVVMPIAGFIWVQRKGRAPMPLISLLLVLTNAMWFVFFPYFQALAWSTVFHGIQYLAIVAIFHVKDHAGAEGDGRGWLYHASTFYALCVVVGYALFQCWPNAYAMLGLSYAQSVLMVVATINIHHFIVDGYIWKLRKDPNYRIVAEGLAA